MKMYEKLGMDLSTEKGLLTAIQFCPYKDSKEHLCTDNRSCSKCKAKYLIQEVKEETYRPYKNTNEMIEDFKTRFNVAVPSYKLPAIWVVDKKIMPNSKSLIDSVYDKSVWIASFIGCVELDDLYKNFTYLDGSPIGKKE